jgi:hypothetical protein
MARKMSVLALVVIAAMMIMVVPAFAAADSAQVNASVTTALIQVSIDTNTLNYGTLDMSQAATRSVEVTNSGNIPEDFQIISTAPTSGGHSWTLGSSIGADQAVWRVSAPSLSDVNLSTGYQALWSNIAVDDGKPFAFQLQMPVSTSFGGVYTMQSTIQASMH